MGPKELKNVLIAAIRNKLPVIIKGKPGIGKSDIVAQVVKELGYEVQISHPQVSDPTDYKGFPFPSREGDRATFLPFGDLYELIHARKPTIAFMDDIGQAPTAVQAALMQLLLARRVNGHKVSEEVTFVAATNRREDMAGVSGLLEPVKRRFAAILELEENLDDWCEWALKNRLPGELIGFIRFRPELLCDFTPSRDLVNSPSLRTVANAARWLLCGGMADPALFSALKGAAGERFAIEFMAFLKIFRNLPDVDRIIRDPTAARVERGKNSAVRKWRPHSYEFRYAYDPRIRGVAKKYGSSPI